jgi:tetratricopeptide (TPR) repeat protein
MDSINSIMKKIKFSPSFPGSMILLLLISTNLLAQVKVTEQEWTIPTYPVRPPDKNPMFFRGESYQGASKYIYPYGMNDAISNEKSDHAWKAVILENEYIKLCITPDIGGKIYYGTDKTDGYNFIYKNDVFKPSNIGMLGAWVSGGIEWCVIHHHRASTLLPVDYEMIENKDGSKTVWIGETEPRHRMRWTIGITSYPGKSYFSAEVKILNPTPYTNSFLYWANVAVHTNRDYQVIFPPSVQVATYHAKNSFTHWPYSTDIYNGQDFTRGVDISWWKNSPEANSYFAYDLKEDFMGAYDHGRQTGTVHIGDHNIVKGAKLWEWGSGPRGQATEAVLTEKAGPYAEIMVGAFSDNQPDYSWIKPYEVKTWKQYWYPVKDIEGFKYANLNGAVNLEKKDDNHVFLGYYSTQKVDNARIILKNGDRTILEKTVTISPEKTFTETIRIDGAFKMTDLSTELANAATNEVLVSYKPVEQKPVGELPETVQKPDEPKNIKTTEELFLTGSRILQFYNPTLNAMDYFEEALRRDPGDIRTNMAVGKIHLKNGEYDIARSYFIRAIQRLTKDYTRPENCELMFLEGLTLRALGLLDEAVDTLYRATWDYAWHSAAYLELARISCMNGDPYKALGQVNESLCTNAINNSALDLKASILRITGDLEGAKNAIAGIIAGDPLDFRACNENYLLAVKSGDKTKAEELLSELKKKMRDFDQNYLELAVGYINDGFTAEAEDILKRFTGRNQEILYYLGYLEDAKGNRDRASEYFNEASAMPVDYGFPFRLESVRVYNLAMKYNPSDSRPYYYMGNLLYDKQPGKALENWENAVRLDPTLAIAWRNLGFGYYNHAHDLSKAISAYEKAVSLKKDDPVYYAELDPLYEMNNSPVSTRARLFESNHDVVKQRDDSFVREIMVLNLSGQAEKSVEYLNNSSFHFREGSSRVRDITADAHILLGRKYLEEKKYDQALQQFRAISDTPGQDDPGTGRGDARDPQVNYFIGLTLEAMGRKSEAKKYYGMSEEQDMKQVSFITYYQGLSLKKLGDKERASEYFNALINEGEKRLTSGAGVDFFAKFGEKEAENVRLSNAYLLKGLGYKGLGDSKRAKENLEKAVDLSVSNLYARVEME